ncbi:AAA family ATPase [Runella sp. MFBS21]|uniref:ATP-dependent nuclease n=1 Tax=Runella sp. MFBS21 TaxID=3034018 RepID=UPI0023F8A6AF|nr:AAA family ATPase [Runella sp. MFBS21]MDF7822076.1 AAA family ATPase [Runella sp. MFBS21]
MKIISIQTYNYRNLDNCFIQFEENCNFIVGENNLGKSNLILLLNTLFTQRAFKENDFKDISSPISLTIELKLNQEEIGHFQDLFTPEECSRITINALQETVEDSIYFFHKETGLYIPNSLIRNINYIYYDSLRNPITEINFDKGIGVGKFLKHIISQHFKNGKNKEYDFIKTEKLDELLASINKVISKIKSFKDFNIEASKDESIENMLSKIIVFKDDMGSNLVRAGYGVQFLILATLSILEKLQYIKNQRGDKGIFENKEGKKFISLVIALDEPEIHLHPYMQRSLIKYLNSIIFNENKEFQELVKDLFNIDEFIGQIIIATHSPNILLNNYKQIIRFFPENKKSCIISGTQIHIPPHLNKHLHINFPFIKEAFFSRCVIFVEGDSEFSSFPLFANTMSVELDDLGISIIQARGDSIQQLMQVVSYFSIPCIGIGDSDGKKQSNEEANYYVTNKRDFEEELSFLIDIEKEVVLKNIIIEHDEKGIERKIEAETLNKRLIDKSGNKKYNLNTTNYKNDLTLSQIKNSDRESLKSYYITWFSINKSYSLGLLIGNHLSKESIPSIYKEIILKAQNLAKNAQS